MLPTHLTIWSEGHTRAMLISASVAMDLHAGSISGYSHVSQVWISKTERESMDYECGACMYHGERGVHGVDIGPNPHCTAAGPEVWC